MNNYYQHEAHHPPQPDGSRWPLFAKAIVGCLVGCAVLLMIVVFLGIGVFRAGTKSISQADGIAREFLQNVKENKPEQAYALTDPEFHQNVPFETWQEYMKKLRDGVGDFGKITQAGQAWHTTDLGTMAKISYSIQGSKHVEQVSMIMRSTGGPFKVLRCGVLPGSSYVGSGGKPHQPDEGHGDHGLHSQ